MSRPDSALQRQLERGALFTHTALGAGYARVADVQALLHGLTDLLLTKGVVQVDELEQAMQPVRAELDARGEGLGPGLVIRHDGPDAPPAAEVDCAARIAVCQAVCCRLDFALSVPELEAGHVRWDLGRPYHIRQEPDGMCCHRGSTGCAVYAGRPGVCRRYSCRHDERIWSDFEAMQLNSDWIEAHVTGGREPRALRAQMHWPPEANEAAP